MKKLFPFLAFPLLFSLNCNNDDPDPQPAIGDDMPAAESCQMTRYLGPSVDMRFNYNTDLLLQRVDYEISSYSGMINVSHDGENRISRISFGNSEILFAYEGNTIRVTNNYSPNISRNGVNLGSGEFVYHLNDDGHFTHAEADGETLLRFETNANGNMTKIYSVYDGSEELGVEYASYDDKESPWRNFPFLTSIISGRNLIFSFAPWELSPNNPLRTTTYFTSEPNASARSYTYNDQGYPISSSQPNDLTFEYTCQ